ncbi:NAD(P)-dependent glycerol-3-phosphate dehydrogenase [Rhodobacteraceae bacterium]|nr:NAD(P)-dependent glycerol-3-phosphate dehydrogenase [Paracoccaceae bacterium]
MSISVLGAGAFGTALAIALSRDGTDVTLWSRNRNDSDRMQDSRKSGKRLPGCVLPESLSVTTDDAAFAADICLLAIPAQKLSGFAEQTPLGTDATLLACCKGIDQTTGLGPVATLRRARPSNTAAILTGPSFAVDIAKGMPTALVLACESARDVETLQAKLTRPNLRLYRTTDVIGAELGGALKNVMALAAGITIGADLGDSARASVIARGFAELTRFAKAKGAETETIQGLSGLGDLILTCTSDKSRNFRAGVDLGKGISLNHETTIEGLATAPTVATEAKTLGLDLPLIQAVADVVGGHLSIASAIETLLLRPVGKE